MADEHTIVEVNGLNDEIIVRAYVDLNAPPSPLDFVTITDHVSLAMQYELSFNETVTIAESANALNNNYYVTDEVTMTEEISFSGNVSVTFTDQPVITDELTTVGDFYRGLADTTTPTDELAKAVDKPLADSCTVTDSATPVLTPGYTKPTMVRTGATGTITSNTAGYLLSGFNTATYAYLDAGKTTGKWYWEVVAADFILLGVTVTPTTTRSAGGSSSFNAGMYISYTTEFWNQWGASPGEYDIINPGQIVSFSLDVAAKTLAIRVNNTLIATISLTSITTPIYAMFAFGAGTGCQVKLGLGNTSYAPPTGFDYL